MLFTTSKSIIIVVPLRNPYGTYSIALANIETTWVSSPNEKDKITASYSAKTLIIYSTEALSVGPIALLLDTSTKRSHIIKIAKKGLKYYKSHISASPWAILFSIDSINSSKEGIGSGMKFLEIEIVYVEGSLGLVLRGVYFLLPVRFLPLSLTIAYQIPSHPEAPPLFFTAIIDSHNSQDSAVPNAPPVTLTPAIKKSLLLVALPWPVQLAMWSFPAIKI